MLVDFVKCMELAVVNSDFQKREKPQTSELRKEEKETSVDAGVLDCSPLDANF